MTPDLSPATCGRCTPTAARDRPDRRQGRWWCRSGRGAVCDDGRGLPAKRPRSGCAATGVWRLRNHCRAAGGGGELYGAAPGGGIIPHRRPRGRRRGVGPYRTSGGDGVAATSTLDRALRTRMPATPDGPSEGVEARKVVRYHAALWRLDASRRRLFWHRSLAVWNVLVSASHDIGGDPGKTLQPGFGARSCSPKSAPAGSGTACGNGG